jgi:putative heme iron utilization protein
MSIDDRNLPTGVLARRLIRTSRTATLATLDQETSGMPYGSLVLTACGLDASPLFAKHGVEALNASRATLLGRMEPCTDARLRARFIRRYETARNHMAFGDFHLYRLVTESVHFIGGFGRIETLDATDVILDPAPLNQLLTAEDDIIAHMNADHTDAIRAYAHNLADRPGLDWRMTGLDGEGCDLARNDAEARIWFPDSIDSAATARAALVALAKEARRES